MAFDESVWDSRCPWALQTLPKLYTLTFSLIAVTGAYTPAKAR